MAIPLQEPTEHHLGPRRISARIMVPRHASGQVRWNARPRLSPIAWSLSGVL